MKNIKNIFYTTFSALLLLPAIAHGFDVNNKYGLPDKEIDNVLVATINWILAFLASLSVLMIIVSGVMYITSGGDDSRITTAKKWLTYSIVGLIVALLSYVIVASVSKMLS